MPWKSQKLSWMILNEMGGFFIFATFFLYLHRHKWPIHGPVSMSALHVFSYFSYCSFLAIRETGVLDFGVQSSFGPNWFRGFCPLAPPACLVIMSVFLGNCGRAGILIGSFTMFFILGLCYCLALLNKKGWHCFSL